MDSEMKLNARLIRKLREDRAWSQDHLAAAAGLSLRTVQRIEAEGNASPESRLSLAAALQVDAATLVAVAEASAAPPAIAEFAAAPDVARFDAAVGTAAASDARLGRFSGTRFDRRVPASRPRIGLIAGTAAGLIGATVGVACAWIAASHGAHSSAELGMTHSVLATIYGLTCAALATMWNRFRQHS
jgi:transcriptional regulator with XRE-family HTH domain